jgi:TRAP-type mannitol/chloroaromatic compound transport system permease small subunit
MLIRNLNHIVTVLGKAVSWLTLLMVLLMFVIVVLRYAFDTGWIAMQELVVYMHALVFMLGGAYTMKKDGHVRVDIFYGSMTIKKKAWVDLLGTVFLLTPMFLFIFYSAWDYVLGSWRVLEGSREAGGIEGVFLLKTIYY